MVSDGAIALAASLVEAAVRAAVLAGAPRRTVAATAAAVASAMVAGRGGDGAQDGAAEPSAVSERRRKKNRRKKERRKEAKIGDLEVAHEAAPVAESTRSGLGVGEHPDLAMNHQFTPPAMDAPPPPPVPPPGPDVTMREEVEPVLMAAPMALSPENLATHNVQQSGHQPREIDFDGQSSAKSQRLSHMDLGSVRAFLGLPRHFPTSSMDSAGTPVPGDDDL